MTTRGVQHTSASQLSLAVVLAGLAASAVALALAPVLMPPGYSWLSNTTSESAAQGVSGGWLARLGFLLFGLSVILLSALARQRWGQLAAGLHAAFGVLMTAAAAFSHRPWIAGQPFDGTEDLLHSAAATGMGFAFAFGVVAAWVYLARAGHRWRLLDVIAVLASVVIPVGMSAWPQADGLSQRLMFAVAYAWYAVEGVRALTAEPRARHADPVTAAR